MSMNDLVPRSELAAELRKLARAIAIAPDEIEDDTLVRLADDAQDPTNRMADLRPLAHNLATALMACKRRFRAVVVAIGDKADEIEATPGPYSSAEVGAILRALRPGP